MTDTDPRSRRDQLVAAPGLFRLMAVAAGLSASALYLAQPLLDELSTAYDLSSAQASWLVTGTQVGYAAGLLFLVPLGDVVRRGRLSARLLLLTAALLATVTVSVDGQMLVVTTVAAAVAAVGCQVLVPMAAASAPDGGSGRAVSIVMAGILSGGLAARAVSGVLADLAGWRSGYWVVAGLLVCAALSLQRRVPEDPGPFQPLTPRRYLSLIRSLIGPLRELPMLRRSALVAALAMSAFTIHLAAITLRLSAPPFEWSTTAIGAFSLLAVVGPVVMPWTGRLADAGNARNIITAGLSLEVLAWALLLATDSTIVGLAAGVVMLVVGQQGVMAATQSRIYDLRPAARSRINAIFMALLFSGGAVGSALASAAWAVAGWRGACAVAIALAAVGLAVQLATSLRSG
jgi:MFS family permease